ncbi:hypothetical protein AX16_006850 [Volvariella volvacea WC 439]|nr:hypothetical protein AX16_006850 [Volvariella volvacea WC 439]
MPPAASSESGNNGHVSLKFHGATLSSFTSIAMEPHPIVTFALRLPSRMATALHDAQAEKPSHMVINLLSAEQAPLAVAFSRPNVHADPFAELNYTLSEEGLPVLGGSLGALSCKLVAPPVPLHDLEFLEKLGKSGNESRCRPIQPHHGVTSELFIARVVRVESLSLRQEGEEDTPRTLPLLYHRRGYTTSQELHRYTKSPLPQPKS